MNLLPTWLWKEWRDHRSVLLATAIVLPLLTLLLEWSLPATVIGRDSVPAFAALIAFTIVALSLFGDVFAGEERRGTLAFLRRQPGGWWPPFAAKFLFLALATTLLCGEAYGGAALAIRVFHGVTPATIDATKAVAIVAALLLIPAWVVVVSIWFPRSTVALPGAIVLLALFAAPILLTGVFNHGLEPTVTEFIVGFVGLLLAAPFIAAWSFARGRFVEREPWRAGVLGLWATLALFTPAYGWTAVRTLHFRELDPFAPSFHVVENRGCLATNGRFAYVTAFHAFRDPWAWRFWPDASAGDGPTHALKIDMQDGSFEVLGGVAVSVGASSPIAGRQAVPFVILADPTAPRRPPRTSALAGAREDENRVLPLFDAQTGLLERADLDTPFMTASDEAGARFQRLSNYLVLPDASHVWAEHGHLVHARVDGSTEMLPDSHYATRDFCVGMQIQGHGTHLGGNTMYDSTRRQRFELPDGLWARWVRGGSWIVVDLAKRRFGTWCARWNPETQEFAPIAGVTKDDQIGEMADDGRLFVGLERVKAANGKYEGWHQWLLDPDTGAKEPLTFSAGVGETNRGVILQGRTPSGRPVMEIFGGAGENSRIARFDLAARRFEVLAPDVATPLQLVGCADEESAVVTDGHRLLRGWFGRPGLEVLFPKEPSR